MTRATWATVDWGSDLSGAQQEPADRAEAFRRLFADAESMRAWLESALPAVYGFVFVRCGADEGVAQDVTQETMVEVVRHRDQFDGRSEPMTWVCGIARHKVADHYRAAHRERRRRLRLVESGTEITTRAEDDDAVTHAAVVEVLRSLPETQRVVLALHYLDGLSVHEISEQLGRSESAVESLLARGRVAFKNAWGGQREVR